MWSLRKEGGVAKPKRAIRKERFVFAPRKPRLNGPPFCLGPMRRQAAGLGSFASCSLAHRWAVRFRRTATVVVRLDEQDMDTTTMPAVTHPTPRANRRDREADLAREYVEILKKLHASSRLIAIAEEVAREAEQRRMAARKR
jgi:hypothetical protein